MDAGSPGGSEIAARNETQLSDEHAVARKYQWEILHMKTVMFSIAAALAAISFGSPPAHAATQRSDSYLMAQATGGAASTNTTTGSTANGNTDPAKGTTTPDANKDSKTPAQK